jgi:opacity protein-like surface antigen
MKEQVIRIFFLSFFLVIAFTGKPRAEDPDEEITLDFEEEMQGHVVYHYPEIAPEIVLGVGIRLVDQEGDSRALEYDYLKNSPWFSGLIRSFSFPHRRYLNVDFENKKDYFADLRYAYGDTWFLRWKNSTLFHNIAAGTLVDPMPPAGNGYDAVIRDTTADYGVENSRNDIFLRWKAHDFPLHIYAAGHHVSREGTIQQRSALGGAIFNDVDITSQSRDIDWTTETYTFGTNSHLGPLEVDLSHQEKLFNEHHNSVLTDAYDDSILGVSLRDAGVFPHNLVPETTGSSNTVKIHSSYTGRWVVSATLIQKTRENKTSGAKNDTIVSNGSVHWMPRTDLFFNLIFTHRDYDEDTPAQVTITDLTDAANSYTYDTKAAIATTKNSVALGARYHLASALTLRAKYNFRETKRSNAEFWLLPSTTRYNTIILSADTRPARNVTADFTYRYKHLDQPAYNTEPDNAQEGETVFTWLPTTRINLLLKYKLARQERSDLFFADTTEPQNRKLLYDNVLTIANFRLLDNLSLSLSYNNFRYRVEQDIEYNSSVGTPITDFDVNYEDKAQVYAAALNYSPSDKLRFTGEVTFINSSGGFDPHNNDILDIGTFSRLDTQEIHYTLTAEYTFADRLALGLTYRYGDFDDILDNTYHAEDDGSCHIVVLHVTKQW